MNAKQRRKSARKWAAAVTTERRKLPPGTFKVRNFTLTGEDGKVIFHSGHGVISITTREKHEPSS